MTKGKIHRKRGQGAISYPGPALGSAAHRTSLPAKRTNSNTPGSQVEYREVVLDVREGCSGGKKGKLLMRTMGGAFGVRARRTCGR